MNILTSTLPCLIQTGESFWLRFVGDSRGDVTRVHAFLPLWFQSTDPVPDWACSSYSRVSCLADGRARFVRSLAGGAHVNEMFDVDGLCRELPQRLKALRQTGGDRIAK